MNSVRTPAEQAKFEELQTYFRFQGRREYLRVQGSFLNSALMFEENEEKRLNFQKQQAELKQQWNELEKEWAVIEIERLKALLES
jgi:hypothetical protein